MFYLLSMPQRPPLLTFTWLPLHINIALANLLTSGAPILFPSHLLHSMIHLKAINQLDVTDDHDFIITENFNGFDKTTEARPDDETIRISDFKIIVDPMSKTHLNDSSIDFVNQDLGARFKITPSESLQVKSGCSCGAGGCG